MIVVAVDAPHGERLVAELAVEGHESLLMPATQPAESSVTALFGDADSGPLLARADALVLAATRATLTPALVHACDRHGVRIVPLAGDQDAAAAASLAGLADPLPLDTPGWRIADALATMPAPAAARASVAPTRGVVLTVWGPAGAPGRSTVAAALAAELARGGRRVALVDADAHAPSLALALGLADEGPGFAAACRQADRGLLDAAELTRISAPLHLDGETVDVLTGLNRPSRWPELTESRVTAALEVCRDWVDYAVVDVAASLERDEEIVSDLDGPRRNGATLAALRAADAVVAVLSCDPVGAARFVRGYAELRATVGATPIAVVANRLRPGALGIDPRGQVRRTLDRFAGIGDVSFLPLDARAADAALLAARPLAEVAPRSPFTLAVRRLAATLLGLLPHGGGEAAQAPQASRPTRRSRRRRKTGARRPVGWTRVDPQ
ncbi:MAG: CpaE family protein [Microbacterium sp.]|uniref:AAA family ATPase n=1 Tax=Microbacterium sp. TaxID=51671 RepID=UPI003A8A6983